MAVDEGVEGLYEDVVTRRLLDRLDRLTPAQPGGLQASLTEVDAAEAPLVLARHLHPVLVRAFKGATPQRQVDLVARILAWWTSRRRLRSRHHVSCSR